MAAKTIFWYCKIMLMLISKKTTGSIYLFIYLFFASKEAYPIVRQFENIMVKKAQAKVVKCAKNKCLVHRTPLGHLSVNIPIFRIMTLCITTFEVVTLE